MIKEKNLDLGKADIKRIFWTYAIPSVLMMIVQSTAGFIDSVFIGKYIGAEGLAAITLIMPLLMFLIGLGAMIAVGGTTLAGIERGSGNLEKSNNLFNLTSSLLLMSGFLGVLLIYSGIPRIAALTGAENNVLTYTIEYARYISIFVPFFLMNFAFGFFLKLDGKPVEVVAIMLSGTIINILLDYLLIGKFQVGIKGAALATGISQLVPFLLFLIYIIFKTSWKIKKPRYIKEEIFMIFFNGSSELLSNISTSLIALVFNYIIMKKMGSDGVASFAVAIQVAGIATSLGYGIAEGSQVAISYNFGAKNYERVNMIRRLTLKISLALGIIMAISSLLFNNELARIFLNDEAIIDITNEILKYYGLSFIFLATNICIATYYTSINDPIRSATITIYRSLVSASIGLLILPFIFGESGIWLTIVFIEFSTFLIGLTILKNSPFGRKKIKYSSIA